MSRARWDYNLRHTDDFQLLAHGRNINIDKYTTSMLINISICISYLSSWVTCMIEKCISLCTFFERAYFFLSFLFKKLYLQLN